MLTLFLKTNWEMGQLSNKTNWKMGQSRNKTNWKIGQLRNKTSRKMELSRNKVKFRVWLRKKRKQTLHKQWNLPNPWSCETKVDSSVWYKHWPLQICLLPVLTHIQVIGMESTLYDDTDNMRHTATFFIVLGENKNGRKLWGNFSVLD